MMKLHTVFITYNRLELTKRAIDSYLGTVEGCEGIAIVDNGSTDGTREWLASDVCGVDLTLHFLDQNRYPGFATNVGWKYAPPRAEFLHRADNDFAFLPGWCEEVERMFQDPKLGQLGLRTDEEEMFERSNTGGNCIIRRELWDKGLRWDERSWPQLRAEVGDGFTEDSFMSPAVRKMGYRWDRVERPCIQNLASGDWGDPYYAESYGIRGIRPRRNDPTIPDDWSGGYS